MEPPPNVCHLGSTEVNHGVSNSRWQLQLLKNEDALARRPDWSVDPVHQRVAGLNPVRGHAWVVGSVPGQGVFGEVTDGHFSPPVLLPLDLTLPASLKNQ